MVEIQLQTLVAAMTTCLCIGYMLPSFLAVCNKCLHILLRITGIVALLAITLACIKLSSPESIQINETFNQLYTGLSGILTSNRTLWSALEDVISSTKSSSSSSSSASSAAWW